MTEEVKRYKSKFEWSQDADGGGSYKPIPMVESPTGGYVTFDDYVAMIQRAERADAVAQNHAALLQRVATAMGVPPEAKVHEALIPAVHQVRGALAEKLEALNADHSSLIILRFTEASRTNEVRETARAISAVMHVNVAMLPEGVELTSLSVNDMSAAGWVPKE